MKFEFLYKISLKARKNWKPLNNRLSGLGIGCHFGSQFVGGIACAVGVIKFINDLKICTLIRNF